MVLRVLSKAGRDRPADTVLREELKSAHGLHTALRSWASQAVFTHERWRGLLEATTPDARSVEQALDWARRFEADPQAIPHDQLARAAVPSWISSHIELNSDWLRSLQQPPVLWLRSPRRWTEEVGQVLWDVQPGPLPGSWSYSGGENLLRSELFHAGKFEIQDLASQGVGWICRPSPGETWWDACAGEGGKLMHLSELMANRGLLWASDRALWRLQRLRRRAARAGVHNYRVVEWKGDGPAPMRTDFDGVLVDAPCSGVGTWQRNPHARWTLEPRDIEELAALQLNLLRLASRRVKPGGRLIYAVCTLTHAETEGVADAFSRDNGEFEPWPEPCPFKFSPNPMSRHCFPPQRTRGNGMFVAIWKKEAGRLPVSSGARTNAKAASLEG